MSTPEQFLKFIDAVSSGNLETATSIISTVMSDKMGEQLASESGVISTENATTFTKDSATQLDLPIK